MANMMKLRPSAAKRLFVAAPSRPRLFAQELKDSSPSSSSLPSLPKDFKFGSLPSPRRVHGIIAMGQSLMPWYSATASASLVSRLQIDGTLLQGRFTGYVSPI